MSGRFNRFPWLAAALAYFTIGASHAFAAQAKLASNIDRPLRYTPEGKDFVIINSPECFNRPLYTNTSFRVDGGDVPEFSLYLPGRGGNLRLGIVTASGAKWVNDAQRIVARYHPGALIYEISDPLLGPNGTLNLTAMVLAAGQGLIVRAETNAPGVTLVFAYGGAFPTLRDSRNGDIGTESQPVTRYFQLVPQNCVNDTFSLAGNAFTMEFRRPNAPANTAPTVVRGLAPPGTQLAIANADQWNNLPNLLAPASAATDTPVVVGRTPLAAGQPVYVALQRLPQTGETVPVNPTYQEITGNEPTTVANIGGNTPLAYDNLPGAFAAAQKRRDEIANKVSVDTPDPFINAAVSALCVAADGVWDEPQGVFMHGAVAWRNRLLGWRGPYSADAFGWFDRAERNMTYWAGRQNTSPILMPTGPDPSPSSNYSRAEPSLHSNGDMSNSHYDMNLVHIDAVMRHLLWTGNIDFLRQEWPVIERHLAWEQRLFRRTFGGDNLPLYEAYAAIWASDDLQYNGGGATHSSAYNYYQNLMAARLARLAGADPAPYEKEAQLIRAAMTQNLWLPDRGWYAEAKDWLGYQLPHPSPAVWTFYHTVDSLAATPLEAWQMSRYVDTQIPHIPVRGPGVPEGYFTLSTTDWMPYTWSLNNVVFAESAHTALAYWQSNRDEQAYKLFKGLVLDSMYLGLCPGNAGMCTYYDANRGESQRDFADGVGAASRAVVEGLFGVQPDALAGELTIRPGFPVSWDHASFHHPYVDYSYKADGPEEIRSESTVTDSAGPRGVPVSRNITAVQQGFAETYTVTPNFPKPMALRLQPVAKRGNIHSVTVNGRPANWTVIQDAVETPRIQIQSPAAPKYEVHIVWDGEPLAAATAPAVAALGGSIHIAMPAGARLLAVADPQGAINDYQATATALDGVVTGRLGNRTVFVREQQGDMNWWVPVPFEVRPAYEIIPAQPQSAGNLTFTVLNNTPQEFSGNATVRVADGAPQPLSLKIPAYDASAPVSLAATGLLPGANIVRVDLGQGRVTENVVSNWKLATTPAAGHLEAVNLAPYFNDAVTEIFHHDYIAPRSMFTSLAVPRQGYGTWTGPTAAPPQIDDSGLRAAAAQSNGYVFMPQGVCFYTAAQPDQMNVLFTSMWNVFPHEAQVPLTGKAAHAYLLMAGTTTAMQSRFDNGEVIVTYTDGTTARLVLENPVNWWPIEQDYFIDDYAFARPEPIPPRVDLRTGETRTLDVADAKGRGGRRIPGGAATVLDLPLDSSKELKSLTVRPLANDIIIGLMAVTLAR